jgi:hypothetical protein
MVIAYYSFTGNTEALAMLISQEAWFRDLEVITIRIRHHRRPHYFARKSLAHGTRRPVIENRGRDLDLGAADVIAVGGPIWHDAVSPFVIEYLDRAEGVRGKRTGVFLTCSYPQVDAVSYAEDLADMVSRIGLDVRGSLGASRKARLQHRAMVRTFMDELLEGTDASSPGDGGGGDWSAVPPPLHR